jgi:dTDP-4-dehydrorhamnose 3,5-epimerase-like enzyme
LKKEFKIINLKKVSLGLPGKLVIAENKKQIPFLIKRFYLLFDTPVNTIRGRHAHKKTKLFLICLNGKCQISIFRKSKKIIKFSLSNKNKGAFINNMVFKEIKFIKKNTLLAVLASEKYNKNDYIYY